MNQDQNNFNQNNYNTQNNNIMPNNQPLNNQNIGMQQNLNVNQTTFNTQQTPPHNYQNQMTQTNTQEQTKPPINTIVGENTVNNKPPKKNHELLIIGIIVSVILVITIMIAIFIINGQRNGQKEQQEQQSQKQEDILTKEDTEAKEWGVPEAIVVYNGKMQTVCIKFPQYAGIPEGTGEMAMQGDGSFVFLDGQGMNTDIDVPEDKIENVFPAYFEQTADSFNSSYIGIREDYAFELKDKELVTIADYEMCKFTGTCSFTIISPKEKRTIDFVAYATKSKNTGAYVYWMVLDESEDGSLGDVIEDHARNMAESIKEV